MFTHSECETSQSWRTQFSSHEAFNLNRADMPLLPLCGCSIIASTNIRDLGVQLDSTMSMAAHVSRTCRTAYAQLRCINRIRSSLPVSARKTLVHALVTSKLDFGNAALYGITGTLLHRLEMVQRAAARVVLGLRRRDQHSMTAALQQLHWLPVAYRIQFKLLTLVHGAIHANTPRYLADRVSASFHAAVFARLISLSLLFQGLTWKGLAGEHSRVQVPPCGMLFHWCYEQSKTLNVSGGTCMKTYLFKQAFM